MNRPYPNETVDLVTLAAHLGEKAAELSPFIVGIDGCGGAGKSRLAAALSKQLSAAIVHVDDFYLPSERRHLTPSTTYAEEFDLARLREEVLLPLRASMPAAYCSYDWATDRLGTAAVSLEPHGVILVEGVFCTCARLRSLYNVTVWVECPRDIRLSRGLARDGLAARDQWILQWMPQEDRYVSIESPNLKADFRFRGFGGVIDRLDVEVTS